MHVVGDAITIYRLPSGEWLRTAYGTASDDVWIGGDGATLLHYDGNAFLAATHPLPGHATFTAFRAAQGELWAVSPSGALAAEKGR